jgi:hypothetical protein
MFAKRVCLEMAPAKWQGRALIFSLLAEDKTLRVMPASASKTLTVPHRRASAMAPWHLPAGAREQTELPGSPCRRHELLAWTDASMPYPCK